jgi:hypothetical protein
MRCRSAWQPDRVVSENFVRAARIEVGQRCAAPADHQQLVANAWRAALSLLAGKLLSQRGRDRSVIDTPVLLASSRARRSVSRFLMLTAISVVFMIYQNVSLPGRTPGKGLDSWR